MKISSLVEQLKSGLGIVGQAVAGRPTLPICSSVLLSVDGSRLTLTANNLEQVIMLPVSGKCEAEGAIVVPYKLFSSLVNELPEDSLVGLSLSEHRLEIKTEHSVAHINCQDSRDFPPTPDCSGGQVITIPARELKRAIDLTVFGVATEYGRPVLCGVSVQTVGDKLQFASADGFRLAIYVSSVPAESVNIIVPAKTMSLVSKLCRMTTNGDGDSEVIIQLGRLGKNGEVHAVSFIIGKTHLVTQLISGAFPDYEKLVPTDFKTTATIGLDDFLRAVRLASITARESSGALRLEMDGDKMAVSGGEGSETGDSTTSIPAALDGEQSAKIAVDYRYLADVLTVFRGLSVSGVTFAMVGPTQPCVVRPVGVDGYAHVVMPIFVQW